MANLRMRVREQVRDLILQSARVDDLSERSVSSQRQEVARNIEGACFQRTVVGLLLHLIGLRRSLCQIAEHIFGERFVFREKIVDGAGVQLPCRGVAAEVGSVVATFSEILVAGGTLLPVPTLLVSDDDGGQDRELFDRKSYVC